MTRELLPLGVSCVEDVDAFELRDGILLTGATGAPVFSKVRVTAQPDRQPEGLVEKHGGDNYTQLENRVRNFFGRKRNTTDERRGECFNSFEFLRPTKDTAGSNKGFWSAPPNKDEEDYWAARKEVEEFVKTCEAHIANNAWNFDPTPRLRVAGR